MRSSHLSVFRGDQSTLSQFGDRSAGLWAAVVGFDTGSLSEIVQGDAGRVVPYGTDHWKLKPPDIPALARAAEEVLEDQPRFRTLGA